MTTDEIERSYENDKMYIIPPHYHATDELYKDYEKLKSLHTLQMQQN